MILVVVKNVIGTGDMGLHYLQVRGTDKGYVNGNEEWIMGK